ncbi:MULTISPECIES: hypothetical protein [unclassified Frondihabitans]|uniref:hypothetical protein n=1 Tax=unclassified Frondihabitans TaxID=2626248 RepID=UPI000FA8A07F|nr:MULTISPECIES: hypothetical protein [unclassified Frondihabitans]RPE77817.1 hypothetical protein EDF37_0479 [Frondihabitans sp. PhB153]RPF08096.1 hypothetical protein EDF39_0480 [Frondihabitans sp. PhB161]
MTTAESTAPYSSLLYGIPDTTDEVFRRPYVDIDEERTKPVSHRYIHGGFEGTDTRFSFYLPEGEEYEGRFYQHVTPVPISENLAQIETGDGDRIVFSMSSGAAFVETNGGGPAAANPMSGVDPTIGAYRANAAAARLFRSIAQVAFGAHRSYGYLFGGSGGAFRTIGAAENTTGAWDGFLPFVIGSPMAMPNVFSVRMHAQRILRDRFPAIVDAHDVGGDPGSLELSAEEAGALEEVTRLGFPPRSWFGYKTMGMHAFGALYPGVMHMDPTYADDFWSKPGYLGADASSSVHRDMVHHTTRIAELLTEAQSRHGAPDGGASIPANAGGVDEGYKHANPVTSEVTGVRLESAPNGWLLGAQLTVHSEDPVKGVLQVAEIDGDIVWFESGQDSSALAVGDEVTVDNASFLAVQTYHRHQVPTEGYPAWDQFRDSAGQPLLPQRPVNVGPLMTLGASGSLPNGLISGKMIVISCLLDREAYPWQADWYKKRVEEHLGSELHERFRLWYIDNALHGDSGEQEHPTRSVDYGGALQAGLRQLAAWVERGVESSKNTRYEVVDSQIIVPARVEERGGVQPVGSLTVNGRDHAVVHRGERVMVAFEAHAPQSGVMVDLATDLAGSGRFTCSQPGSGTGSQHFSDSVTFDHVGTYFLSVRFTAQVAGNAQDPHERVQNLARARVQVVV